MSWLTTCVGAPVRWSKCMIFNDRCFSNTSFTAASSRSCSFMRNVDLLLNSSRISDQASPAIFGIFSRIFSINYRNDADEIVTPRIIPKQNYDARVECTPEYRIKPHSPIQYHCAKYSESKHIRMTPAMGAEHWTTVKSIPRNNK